MKTVRTDKDTSGRSRKAASSVTTKKPSLHTKTASEKKAVELAVQLAVELHKGALKELERF